MKVALIGNSHAQALWPRVQSVLEAGGHVVTLARAEPGWTAARYRSEGSIGEQLFQATPDYVIIELGANNWNRGNGYLDDVKWLIDSAKAAGARTVLWLGPPTPNAAVAPDIAKAHELTSNMQAANIPSLGAEWVDSRNWAWTGHGSDGVHYTLAGYDSWAEDILASFEANQRKFPIGVLVGVSVLALLAAIVYRVRS
jgi:lysophospholipase L1-like esterase